MEIKYLEVLVMPNSEILCGGETVGYTKTLGKYLKGLAVTQDEAKAIKASFGAFEREARSDEPHWTYEDSYKALYKKIKDFVDAK